MALEMRVDASPAALALTPGWPLRAVETTVPRPPLPAITGALGKSAAPAAAKTADTIAKPMMSLKPAIFTPNREFTGQNVRVLPQWTFFAERTLLDRGLFRE